MLEELHLNPVWPENSLAPSAAAATPAAPLLDLAALVTAHTPLLFRVALSVLRSRPAAEDAVQETFLRVLQHQRDLPSVRDLRPWLVRITWRLALDHRRRLRPGQIDDLFAASLVSPGLSPEAALAHTRRLSSTLAEIDRLPRAEREVLLLSALEELDHAELSATLGKTSSATRALLFRARTRLRDRLSRKGLL